MSAGKEEEGKRWSCCAVKQLQFYHRLTGSVRWWRCGSREGCGNTRVWYHRGCVCAGGRDGNGMCWGGGGEHYLHPFIFTCISHSENGMQTTISGGTSNVCRGLHPHMQ